MIYVYLDRRLSWIDLHSVSDELFQQKPNILVVETLDHDYVPMVDVAFDENGIIFFISTEQC